MSKQEQFLWLVQTATLSNGMNLTASAELSTRYRHCYSATWTLIIAGEAARASEFIPDTMTACEAAFEFCTFMFDNLRHDAEDARHGKRLEVPAWFARPDGSVRATKATDNPDASSPREPDAGEQFSLSGQAAAGS
jgi:hypothetical protein